MPASLPRPSRWKEYGIPALLLVLTVGSVYLHGGPKLVFGVLSIVLAHEMGHYLACRYYGVDATLPHLLPGLAISIVGSFGAFIRIRGRMPNRRALFDIGAAGPIAGFIVALPFLYFGIAEAQIVPEEASSGANLALGDPLIFKWIGGWLHASAPEGSTLLIGEYGLAAWFGLLLTALNLMPAGQLDGGHVVYSLLGRRMAHEVSRLVLAICAGLIFVSPSWILWTVLLWFLIGRSHPPTEDETAPVGPVRAVLGVLCLAIFAVSFTPSPFVNSWGQVGQLVRELLGFTSH